MAIKYELSDAVRRAMAKNEPVIKAALCKIANKTFSLEGERAEGIHKYEGGVVVNRKEIAIKHNLIVDDWGDRSLDTPTAEELAVSYALQKVSSQISEAESPDKALEILEQNYGSCTRGDPLRDLIGPD